MANSTLTEAEQFFYDHAGYDWDNHDGETEEQGHERCARELAQAEQWAMLRGAYVLWNEDWSVNHTDEYPDAYDSEPQTCEYATLWLDGEVVTSLGCIDDADDSYRRVIEAELASEALSHIWLKSG